MHGNLSLKASIARMTLFALGLSCLIADQALADVRQLEAIQTIDGGPEPAGEIPWVRATFDDHGKGGGRGLITLVFEPVNLVGAEHITGLYLNLDPQLDPKQLGPGPFEKSGAFDTPTSHFGANAFQVGDGGRYDIYFEFASAGDSESLLGPGDSFSLLIGSPFGLPLSAASFDFPSAGGSSGPFYMAARVEGIGPNNESAWIVTPEPSSASLAVIACAGLALYVRWRTARAGLISLAALLLLPAPAFADVRHLEAIQTIDGGPELAGEIPWVRATFDDKGMGGHGPVTLTFEGLNLTGEEHLTALYLNLTPEWDATKLALFPIEKHGGFASPKVTFGNDAFQAGSDGMYDIYFEFTSSGGAESLFGVGDWFSLRFGSDGLPITAASFDFPSTSGGTSGPFYMAARVEGIGPNNESAWIATPEPSSAILAAIAFVGVALTTRWRVAGKKLLALGLLLLLPSASLADVRQLEAIQTIDGGPEPAGKVPWVRATFDDFGLGGRGSVKLTFEPLNLTGTEHVTGLYLNFDPQFDPKQLSPGPITKNGVFDTPLSYYGANAFHAGGDQKFDFYFEFASSGNADSFFGVGDSFSLFIGSAFGLPVSAQSFDFPTAGGGSGPFYMAARIEGIGPNNESAWIATPEPSTYMLSLVALLGVPIVTRGRRVPSRLR